MWGWVNQPSSTTLHLHSILGRAINKEFKNSDTNCMRSIGISGIWPKTVADHWVPAKAHNSWHWKGRSQWPLPTSPRTSSLLVVLALLPAMSQSICSSSTQSTRYLTKIQILDTRPHLKGRILVGICLHSDSGAGFKLPLSHAKMHGHLHGICVSTSLLKAPGPFCIQLRIVILDRLDYCANTKNFESMVGKLGIKISQGKSPPTKRWILLSWSCFMSDPFSSGHLAFPPCSLFFLFGWGMMGWWMMIQSS